MAALEAILQKVEAGEVLEEGELAQLEAAARTGGSFPLELALAHALMNAGAEPQALPRLERLARDFPNQVQAHLGLARALIGLERWADGERALQAALRVNPGDPEALKSLAVVSLRAGERTRARQLVADVLRVDPLDEEARLLKEELDAPELPGPPKPVALRREFVAALQRELRGLRLASRRDGGDLLVRTPSGVSRVAIDSLYAAYLGEGGEVDAWTAQTARRLGGDLGQPMEREALLAKAMPVIRPAGFEAQARGAARREGPAGWWIFYVLDDPEFVRYVPAGLLALDALDRAAFANLEARPARPRQVHASSNLWALCEQDGYDAARLLTAAQRPLLVEALGPPPYRASIAQRELVLLTPEGSAARLPEGEQLRIRADWSWESRSAT